STTFASNSNNTIPLWPSRLREGVPLTPSRLRNAPLNSPPACGPRSLTPYPLAGTAPFAPLPLAGAAPFAPLPLAGAASFTPLPLAGGAGGGQLGKDTRSVTHHPAPGIFLPIQNPVPVKPDYSKNVRPASLAAEGIVFVFRRRTGVAYAA